jgi:hypothetical protein
VAIFRLVGESNHLDVLSATAAGLEGMNDLDVFSLGCGGRQNSRHPDVHTMPEHFSEFLMSGRRSPGVFPVSQRDPVSEMATVLLAGSDAQDPVLNAAISAEWKGSQVIEDGTLSIRKCVLST